MAVALPRLPGACGITESNSISTLRYEDHAVCAASPASPRRPTSTAAAEVGVALHAVAGDGDGGYPSLSGWTGETVCEGHGGGGESSAVAAVGTASCSGGGRGNLVAESVQATVSARSDWRRDKQWPKKR
eukprot:5505228-Pleurochrysis_carterae.AAC.3